MEMKLNGCLQLHSIDESIGFTELVISFGPVNSIFISPSSTLYSLSFSTFINLIQRQRHNNNKEK